MFRVDGGGSISGIENTKGELSVEEKEGDHKCIPQHGKLTVKYIGRNVS